jgi:hypothetical protein
VLTCPTAGPDAGVPPFLSAGSLTVSGFGASPTTIQPDSTNSYFQIIQNAQFTSGTSVTVQAAGAAVPAFSVQGAAPPTLQVLTPACMLSGCGTISRSSGLTITWMPASAGSMLARVGSGTSAVSCLFPASAGTGQIPGAALAGLPTGMGALSLGGGTIATTQAGAYRVRLSLIAGAGAPVTIAP